MSNFDLSLNNITLIYFNYTSYPQVQEGLLQRYKMKRFTTSIAHNVSRGVHPVDTGRKLNVHKTFRRRLGRLLTVLCTFNLRPVSAGHVKCLCESWTQLWKDTTLNLFTDTTAMSIDAGPMKPWYKQEWSVRKILYKSLLSSAYLWSNSL